MSLFDFFPVRISQRLELSSDATQNMGSQARQTKKIGGGQHNILKRFRGWPPKKCVFILKDIVALSATVETTVVK
jgi:hypothetical protein